MENCLFAACCWTQIFSTQIETNYSQQLNISIHDISTFDTWAECKFTTAKRIFVIQQLDKCAKKKRKRNDGIYFRKKKKQNRHLNILKITFKFFYYIFLSFYYFSFFFFISLSFKLEIFGNHMWIHSHSQVATELHSNWTSDLNHISDMI